MRPTSLAESAPSDPAMTSIRTPFDYGLGASMAKASNVFGCQRKQKPDTAAQKRRAVSKKF